MSNNGPEEQNRAEQSGMEAVSEAIKAQRCAHFIQSLLAARVCSEFR